MRALFACCFSSGTGVPGRRGLGSHLDAQGKSAAVALLVALSALGAQAQVLATAVGGAVIDGALATSTPLATPKSVVVLPSGDFVVADGNLICKVEAATGIMRVIAGGGSSLDDGAGIPAKSAQLNDPSFMIADSAGNLLFSDTSNHRVRKLTPSGTLSTVVGDGVAGFSGNGGPAIAARLNSPRGLALASDGTLYIADGNNYVVRKVDLAGRISTLAGQPGSRCPSSDPITVCGDGGPASKALFTELYDLALDGRGGLLVSDTWDFRVRRIDLASGVINAFAGSGVWGFSGDGGPATQARFAYPTSLAIDAAGNVYISDEFNHCVRVVRTNGTLATAAGGGNQIGSGFAATQTALNFPAGLFPDGAGNLWVMDAGNGLVRSMNLASGIMTTKAGTLDVGDGGPPSKGVLSLPRHIRMDAAGNLYIADQSHHRIRKVTAATGLISTVAGNGTGGVSGDNGAATAAGLLRPGSVALDDAGNLYIADTDNNRIRRVDGRSGIITTLSGSGTAAYSGDGGPATLAGLVTPRCVSFRSSAIFVCEGDRIRRIDLVSGAISTVAGGAVVGFAGDGGPATRAQLFEPTDVVFTSGGEMIIADTRNQVLRRVDAAGIITTFAGAPTQSGYSGDGGPARLARLNWPVALTVDRADNIYIADFNGTVRKIAPGGTITTVVGTGMIGGSPDGTPAALARLFIPFGLALDGAGNLYIGEICDRVRFVRFDAAPAVPRLWVAPASLDFQVPDSASSPVTRALRLANSNFGPLAWSASAATENGGNWLVVAPNSGAAPAAIDVTVNPAGLAPNKYRGTITVSGAGASDSPQPISVEMTILGSSARLSVSSTFLTFQATQGKTPASQALTVQSTGGGSFSFTVAASTRNGGAWLAVSDTGGSAPKTLDITARTSGLPPGSYQGQVAVTRTGSLESAAVEVVLLVAPGEQPLLQVSQQSFSFYGTEGALTIPAQDLLVVNSGQGTLQWSAEVVGQTGGDWLRASAVEGGAGLAAGGTGRVRLQARPGDLKAGIYSALVLLKAPGAKNAPQAISARLLIQTSDTPPRALLEPGGLVFQAGEGGSPPALQTLQLNTTGGQGALSFSAQPATESGGNWLSVTPQAGTLLGSSETFTLSVQVNTEKLAAGAYSAKIAVSLSNGVLETIPVLLLVTPAGSADTAVNFDFQVGGGPVRAAGCAPNKQFLGVQRVTSNFAQSAGWGSQLIVKVLDNCGTAVTNSTIVAQFSSGDSPVPLPHQGSGVYTASWIPSRPAAQVDITFYADHGNFGRATAKYTASVAAGNTPRIAPGGLLHAASYARHIAPGALISLFGENLAAQTASADRVPLPTVLRDVSVKVGDRDAPLLYAGNQQVNIQIPWEAGENTVSTAVVSARGIVSAGEWITIETAQPGIFSVSGDGKGQGAILDARYQLVNGSNPARAGDVIQIFAAGLGATSPPARTGEPAPSSPLAVLVTPVRCTIGGAEAPVEFQGLAPGFVGLYQVNVRVPQGVAPGSAVPVALAQNGISSNTVTIAVQ
jgi:uncharacterized protein (TIGR03437 family)